MTFSLHAATWEMALFSISPCKRVSLHFIRKENRGGDDPMLVANRRPGIIKGQITQHVAHVIGNMGTPVAAFEHA